MRLSIACIHQYRYGKRVSIRFCQAVESHRSCGLRNRLACLARKERQVHKGTQSSNDGGDEQVHASRVKMASARGQRVQAAWFAAMRNRSMGPSCRMRQDEVVHVVAAVSLQGGLQGSRPRVCRECRPKQLSGLSALAPFPPS
jgi:hypothetical protein